MVLWVKGFPSLAAEQVSGVSVLSYSLLVNASAALIGGVKPCFSYWWWRWRWRWAVSSQPNGIAWLWAGYFGRWYKLQEVENLKQWMIEPSSYDCAAPLPHYIVQCLGNECKTAAVLRKLHFHLWLYLKLGVPLESHSPPLRLTFYQWTLPNRILVSITLFPLFANWNQLQSWKLLLPRPVYREPDRISVAWGEPWDDAEIDSQEWQPLLQAKVPSRLLCCCCCHSVLFINWYKNITRYKTV